MTTNRRRVRRTATLATTAAAVALTAGLLTACDPTDTSDTSGASRASNSLNCLKDWNTIADSLKAIDDAESDPTRAAESLAEIHADSDDTKVDTSVAVVVIKTHVTAADSFDSATGRIKAFIDQTPKVGRTEILRDEDWNLTIIGPEQYRGAIVAKVAEDARATATAFGAGYGVSVSGLEKPVDWRQSGPLDLDLFIPYELTIQPLGR